MNTTPNQVIQYQIIELFLSEKKVFLTGNKRLMNPFLERRKKLLEENMNNRIPMIIAVLSLVAAVGGISVGVKASNDKIAAQNEAKTLRDQLNSKNNTTKPAPESPTPLVAIKELSSIGTNDVAELQEQLAARDAELARLQAEIESRNNRGPRQSFQDRMAQLKEEDPERYAEIIKDRADRQQQMRYDQATRLATFVNMDTSDMSEEELANHNLLVEKLSNLWKVTGEFDPETPPNRETMRELFGSFREIGDMMDQERSYMLKQLGADVGLAGEDADNFTAYVEDIIESTSMRPPGRGNRGSRQSGN